MYVILRKKILNYHINFNSASVHNRSLYLANVSDSKDKDKFALKRN
jgi:hypothetical protein